MRKNNFAGNTRMLSLSAMFAAMTVVVLYLSYVFPNMKFTFYFLSSVFVAGILVERRVFPAFMMYIAAALLSLLLLPLGYALPYVILFGHYGIGKYLIEEKMARAKIAAFLVKLLYFDAFLVAVYFAVYASGLLPMGEAMTKLPVWALALITQPIFLAFDFIYSKITVFYVNNIRSIFFRR